MKITYTPEVFLKLSIIENIVGQREFSGYGFVKVNPASDSGDMQFLVYDIVLLDVGTYGYTEIPSSKILPLFDREDAANRKLWFHAHPLGNGKPGPHNWSGTDQATCTDEPLGSTDPNSVKWALASVLTPGGWVGRVDQFKDEEHKTTHIPVEIDMDFKVAQIARDLLEEQEAGEGDLDDWPFEDDADFKPKESFDTSHADIDEAIYLLDHARNLLKQKQYQDAADMINWVIGVANTYYNSAYVGHRAKTLKKSAEALSRALRRRAGGM